MATFSTNQARQIYVAKQVVASPDLIKDDGDIALGPKTPGESDYIYFSYKGPDTPMRSDLIKKDLIMSARLTHGHNIQKKLSEYEVTLDDNVSDTPIAGQEYLLRIDMLGYVSLGMENTYQKYGYVKGTKNMTASQFYVLMAKSLAGNFAREPYPVYQFFVSTGSTEVEVTATTDVDDLTGTYTKLVIREVSGYWHRGTDEDMPQLAKIFTDRILVNGSEAHWGEVKQLETGLKSRKDSVYRQLADLEYFLMGERADQYRFVGWPKTIYTKYMIDNIGLTPAAFDGTNDTSGVGIIDIHYAYVGSNEAVQKSEKDICIIIPYDTLATGGAKKLAQDIADAGVKIQEKNFDGEVSEISPAEA